MTESKSNGNGATKETAKMVLPASLAGLLAVVPGTIALFRDVPTRDYVHQHVREAAPFIKHQQVIDTRLDRLERRLDNWEKNSSEASQSMVKLNIQMESVLNKMTELDKKVDKLADRGGGE
jgi:uncharacterized coiled-coil protein SlyX